MSVINTYMIFINEKILCYEHSVYLKYRRQGKFLKVIKSLKVESFTVTNICDSFGIVTRRKFCMQRSYSFA